MQKAQEAIPTKKPLYKAVKKRKRMKKIGLAMTEEMYNALEGVKVKYFAATVPELCRIALTKFLAEDTITPKLVAEELHGMTKEQKK
jgi:hypothetical protein